MKLTVRKLGLIERAELDICPLTVLIGPNGTNKTWVAYALYGLMRDLMDLGQHSPGFKSFFASGAEGLDARLAEIAREMTEVAKKKQAGISVPLSSTPLDSSRKAPVTAILEGSSLFLREVLRLRGEIAATARVKLQVDIRELRSQSEPVSLMLRPGPLDTYVSFARQHTVIPNDYLLKPSKSKQWLESCLIRHLLWQPARQVFVLPAERKTLASAHDLLRDEFTQAMSLPVADYAEFLRTERNLLSRGLERNGSPRLKDLAQVLESSIVQGSVGFRQGAKPIHAASSLVRAVAGLDLYLKSHATPGDFVVIDELEMNAHPEAQLALTELVAILVNRGLRVVMTTHSPYVVEHLNNLMAAARVPARRQAKLASRFRLRSREAFLPSHKVAAYNFLPEAGKVKVTDVLEREEDTIDWRTFSRVTDELGDIAGHVLEAKRGA